MSGRSGATTLTHRSAPTPITVASNGVYGPGVSRNIVDRHGTNRITGHDLPMVVLEVRVVVTAANGEVTIYSRAGDPHNRCPPVGARQTRTLLNGIV